MTLNFHNLYDVFHTQTGIELIYHDRKNIQHARRTNREALREGSSRLYQRSRSGSEGSQKRGNAIMASKPKKIDELRSEIRKNVEKAINDIK